METKNPQLLTLCLSYIIRRNMLKSKIIQLVVVPEQGFPNPTGENLLYCLTDKGGIYSSWPHREKDADGRLVIERFIWSKIPLPDSLTEQSD